MRTFAEDLQLFAESIDSIDNKLFKRVIDSIKRYTTKRWGIEEVKIMKLDVSDDGSEKMLRKFMLGDYEDNGGFIPMNSAGQMPFIVKQKKPAWIICNSEDTALIDCNEGEYKDCWSNLQNIPKYLRKNIFIDTKTSIIIPFFKEQNNKKIILGVINFESSKYLKINEESKKELSLLTEVITHLLYLNHIYRKNYSNSNSALKELNSRLSNNIYYSQEDKIFFAYSNKCDKEVKECIIKTIQEVNEETNLNVELVEWKNINKPGYITQELFKKIYNCKYGICYLSEPADNKEFKFQDNTNVLFEAGFMHAKYHNVKNRKPKWILIREKDSQKLLFDLRDLRRIEVYRKNGELDKEKFKAKLSLFLKNIYLEF